MKKRLEDTIIIIPLNLSLKYPCDFIDQTAKILAKKNLVILFDYYFPYSWKNLLRLNNFKKLLGSFFSILKLNKIVYFRAPAILPFSRFKTIIYLNKKLGFWALSVFLMLLRKRVVVWQFYPLIIKKLSKKQFFIYDCVDYIGLEEQIKKIFYDEKELFKISDLVVFNSKGLFKQKLKSNPILVNKSALTVCGCNNELFQSKSIKLPKEYVNIPQKKIVFMGIFDYRVDVKLLNHIVTNNKDVKFVFIGPIRENVEKEFNQIKKEENVLYLGEKRKNELAAYLNNSDLGIIPYNTKYDSVKYSNPMKAYEYFASGLPIVSTKILALEDYPKDIVYTTDSQEEFSQTIKTLVSGWNNKKSTFAKKIAKENSWDNKIKKIEKNIIKKYE